MSNFLSNATSHPINRAQYVLVLWGEKFDEVIATLFAVEARRIGLSAKVVGVNGIQAAGGNGLTMTADLTLGQAMLLSDNAISVVVPCSAAILQRLENDPRIPEFFQHACANRALFVVSHPSAIERSSLRQLQIDPAQLSFYSNYQNLCTAVHQIVQSLFYASSAS